MLIRGHQSLTRPVARLFCVESEIGQILGPLWLRVDNLTIALDLAGLLGWVFFLFFGVFLGFFWGGGRVRWPTWPPLPPLPTGLLIFQLRNQPSHKVFQYNRSPIKKNLPFTSLYYLRYLCQMFIIKTRWRIRTCWNCKNTYAWAKIRDQDKQLQSHLPDYKPSFRLRLIGLGLTF